MLLQNGLIVGLFMLLIGIALFAVGLYFYKKKQLIADTPTSKIRSIAMGLIEIFGQVIPIKERLFKSPFTDKECVYYQFTIEEYQSSGKNSHWVTIKKGEQRGLFYLKDDTGMVLIDPTGAKIEARKDFEYQSGLGKDPPEQVIRFLATNNLAHEGFFGLNKTMRYRETIIAPDEILYTMGTADVNPFVNDTTAQEGVNHTIIKKGTKEKMFFISDKKEKDILRGFTVKVAGGIIVGSFFIIIGVLIFAL
jgi:hypothetical protein